DGSCFLRIRISHKRHKKSFWCLLWLIPLPDSPTEFPLRGDFNDHRVAVSERGVTFILGILGVDLLAQIPKFPRIDDPGVALDHHAPEILPRLGVVIEDNGHVGIAFNVADLPGGPFRTEVDLVRFKERTHRDTMRNTV